jgi:outer membrane protein assembly factor BamD
MKSDRNWRRPGIGLLGLMLLFGLGCRHQIKEDPILQLSAGESLLEGKRLLEKEKFGTARKYLSHAFEVEPNSVQGREALLLVADAHFLEGGSDNFIQAEAKYRDFQNRFPTSDRAGYVQYQIAGALAARMEKPDRDQEVTYKALSAYEDLLRIYPTSEYAAAARDGMGKVKANLASHELSVGRFYLRYGLAKAAKLRLEYLLVTYPEYPDKEAVLFYLGRSYDRLSQVDDATRTFDQLRQEFPQSRYLDEIGKRPQPTVSPAPPAAASSQPAAEEAKPGA